MGEKMRSCMLYLALGECASSFNLQNAVCNHGFFMMAPNNWIPSSQTLQRPLRLANSSVLVSISHPYYRTSILVKVHGFDHISSTDQQLILDQVARMLRISKKDERDVKEFQNVHPEAKKRGFGRLFRSPTLFEDIIKSILLCNCTWERTLNMSEALCELQIELTKKGLKRKRATGKSSTDHLKKCNKTQFLRNFPSPRELADLDKSYLSNRCNLGYRADYIIRFASNVNSGKFKLSEFEEEIGDRESYARLNSKLMSEKGFGFFTRANVLMCVGYYENIPIDTETTRHLFHTRAIKECNKIKVETIVEEIYRKYAPFQCLAYWLELLEYYESQLGRLSELPQSSYRIVAGNINYKVCEMQKEQGAT